jgi:hypothetical protein
LPLADALAGEPSDRDSEFATLQWRVECNDVPVMRSDAQEIPSDELARVTGGVAPPSWVVDLVKRKVAYLARRAAARRDVNRWLDQAAAAR